MKILIITPFYYIEGRPDLKHDTNAIHYFAKYWSDNNEVKVLNVYPHSYKDAKRYISKKNRKYYKNGYVFVKDNVEICIAEVQKLPGQKGDYNFWQCQHIIGIFKRWIDCNSFCPDVILIHVPSYAYKYMEKIRKYIGKKIPIIGILHKTDIEELERNCKLKRFFENSFQEIYARSHGIRRKAGLLGLKNLKQDIIQSGIPLEQSEGKSAPYTIDTQLKIIFVGKLIPLKNVDKIIDAITRINNEKIRLEIVGSGIEEKKLKQLVKDCGIQNQVEFVGKLQRELVFEHMANANLFCMPSYPETLGLTYLEAMSVGCVPIGSQGEGIDGIIIDGKNGYLVTPSNVVNDLIEKIELYCQLSNSDRKQISENAKATVMKLDESVCAECYLGIIRRSIRDAANK